MKDNFINTEPYYNFTKSLDNIASQNDYEKAKVGNVQYLDMGIYI